ncbi:Hypothetical predicted protein [Paramuricea clavata]|uniref:Uncharacterized protein n=1 Tax=Paramuricea clavata TaxID=317549 RepID=A0A6S7K7R0_PARCT|nr:Hypothetical predicted protein [Paramuricea clavata]
MGTQRRRTKPETEATAMNTKARQMLHPKNLKRTQHPAVTSRLGSVLLRRTQLKIYNIQSGGLLKIIMPRPARRKREKEKELAETAKRMRKLTSFFNSAPTKEVDFGSNSTQPSTTETPPTCSSHHSDSESNFNDPGPTSSSEIQVAQPTELSTPTASDNLASDNHSF